MKQLSIFDVIEQKGKSSEPKKSSESQKSRPRLKSLFDSVEGVLEPKGTQKGVSKDTQKEPKKEPKTEETSKRKSTKPAIEESRKKSRKPDEATKPRKSKTEKTARTASAYAHDEEDSVFLFPLDDTSQEEVFRLLQLHEEFGLSILRDYEEIQKILKQREELARQLARQLEQGKQVSLRSLKMKYGKLKKKAESLVKKLNSDLLLN